MPKFQFRADQFRAASLMISKEETWYYLNGVLIEPDPAGGIFLVATDGHRLVVIHDPNGYAERPAILKCDWKSPALKTKRGELGRRVYLDGNDATIYDLEPGEPADADASAAGVPIDRMLFREIDGKFPEWRRVVPIDPKPDPEKANGVLTFTAGLLNEITASARILLGNGVVIMELFQGNTPPDASIIRFAELHDAVYVLMPFRSSGIAVTPDWLRLPEGTNEAAA